MAKQKLYGRDVNGMHPGSFGKADTSAIKAPKIGANATLDEVLHCFESMIKSAVDVIYGDSKDPKYSKIVDNIMFRTRPNLQKVIDNIQDANSESQKQFEKFIDDFPEEIRKIVEKHSSKPLSELTNTINEQIQKITNESAKKQNDKSANSTSQSTSVSQTVESSSSSSIGVSHETTSSQPSTFDLLVDLQKQITDSFAKIESLITTNAVQKSAETAVDSTQKPIEQQIVNRQKSSEKEVKSQISSLNSKLGPDAKQKDVKESKESKEDKKRKKNDLKDVMTGKQFDLLKKLLTRQFNDVIDTSDIVVKKVNRGFKDINKRLDKLIKDRTKNGFSWIKLMLFASIFLFPALWAKILDFTRDVLMPAVMTAVSDFLKWIDKKFDINKKITDIIDKIDWAKHIKSISSRIWAAVKGGFNKLVVDPLSWAFEAVSNVFHSCVSWVKDLWEVVTGSISGKEVVKKRKEFEDRHIREDEARIEQTVNRSCSKTEQHFDNTGKIIEQTSQASTKSIKDSTEKANAAAVEGKEKIESEFKNTVQKNNDASAQIDSMSKTALASASTSIDKSLADTNNRIADITSKHAQNLEKTADNAVKEMQKNGGPTNISPGQLAAADNAMAQTESSEITPPHIDTSMDSLQNVQQYTRVNLDKRDNNTGASSYIVEKNELKSKYGSIDPGNHSLMIERLRNRAVFGQYAKDSDIVQQQKMKAHESRVAERNGIRAERDAYAEKITSEQTSESEHDREARLYDNVDKGFNAVIHNSELIETGLTKNGEILDSISKSVNEYFSQLNEYMNDAAKNSNKTENNVGITISPGVPNAASNSKFDAGMSN